MKTIEQLQQEKETLRADLRERISRFITDNPGLSVEIVVSPKNMMMGSGDYRLVSTDVSVTVYL